MIHKDPLTGVYQSQKSNRYGKVGVEFGKYQRLCVVAVRAKLLYVLPGFDVLAVELCHIQVKGSSKIERPEDTFDLFTRNDFSFS